MNPFITIGGKPVVGPNGIALLKYEAAAPNAVDLNETVTLRTDNEGDRYLTLDLPGGDYSAYSRLNIIFKATDGNGNRVSAMVSVLDPAAGEVNLGYERDILIPLMGLVPDYQIAVVDTSDRVGVPGPAVAVEQDADVDLEPPQIEGVTITGTGITGTVHTANVSAIGNPAPTIAYQWKRDGTNISLATASTYTPVSADDATTLTVAVTATNSEGEDVVTSDGLAIVEQIAPDIDSASITGSGQTGTSHAATYVVGFAGKPVATPTYQWKLDTVDISGATSSTYTPNTAGNLTVRVTLTNVVNSDAATSAIKTITTAPVLTVPDITAASITGTTAAGSVHGLSVTAVGTPTPTLSYQWRLNGGAVSGATAATYTSPANSTATLTCVITATNSQGTDTFTTAAITLVPVQPLAPASTDWDFQTTNPTALSTELNTIRVKVSRSATGVQATTTALASDADAAAAGHFEDLTLISTDATWQTWQVNSWPNPVVTRDFSIFGPLSAYPGDAVRAGRLAIRIKTASDVWSPRSAVKAVVIPAATGRFTEGDWIPIHARTYEQYIGNGTASAPQPTPAGSGHQFFRSYANSPADPDFIFMGMDVSIPAKTEDFGGWFEHPNLIGLKAGRSIDSVAIDSENADHVIVMSGNANLRGRSTNLNGWDDWSGLYKSTNRGDTFSLKHNIPSLCGTNGNLASEDTVRFMRHCICEVPDATKTEFTRHWWAIATQMPSGSPITGSLILKSTNGGDSWTQMGTLSASTYDMVSFLRTDGTNWWMGTKTGLFKASSPDGTWTNITTSTNLPAGMATEIDLGGAANEVWVSIRGDGLWKTTNGGTGDSSWTEVFNYNIETFAISPHNRDIILVAGKNNVLPRRSDDGGATWDAGTGSNGTMGTTQMPGQSRDFEHKIQDSHAYFIFHKTDPNLVFAARYQHHGRSTNAGATFVWQSANFDYNYVYGQNADPANWRTMIKCMTDRICMVTFGADDYAEDYPAGVIDNTFKSNVGTTIGNPNGYIGAGRGGMILRNGSHVIYVGSLGDSDNRQNLYFKPANGNTLGVATRLTYYGAQWSNVGINYPTDNSIGFQGRARYTLNSDGTVSQKDMGKEIVGIDANGNLYGVNKSTSSKVVFKTTDSLASGTITWSTWATLSENIGAVGSVRGFSHDPTSTVGKIAFPCANGKIILAENGSGRTIANASTVLGTGFPEYTSHTVALDPFSSAAYCGFYVYGAPAVFKTDNVDSVGTPTWYNIASAGFNACPNDLFIHPVTGDLFSNSNSGNYIYPAHVKQANSYYDEVYAVVSQYQV